MSCPNPFYCLLSLIKQFKANESVSPFSQLIPSNKGRNLTHQTLSVSSFTKFPSTAHGWVSFPSLSFFIIMPKCNNPFFFYFYLIYLTLVDCVLNSFYLDPQMTSREAQPEPEMPVSIIFHRQQQAFMSLLWMVSWMSTLSLRSLCLWDFHWRLLDNRAWRPRQHVMPG